MRIWLMTAGLLVALMSAVMAQGPLYKVPQGWKQFEKGSNIYLVPEGLGSGEVFAVGLTPPEKLVGNFRQWFEAQVPTAVDRQSTLVKQSQVQAQRTARGDDVLTAILVVNTQGKVHLRVLVSVNRGNQVQSLLIVASSVEVFKRYSASVDELVQSWDFPGSTDNLAHRQQELYALQQEAMAAAMLLSSNQYQQALDTHQALLGRVQQLAAFSDAKPGSLEAGFNATRSTVLLQLRSNIQYCLVNLGRFEEGLEAAKQILADVNEKQDPALAANTHRSLAKAYYGLLQYERALREAELARKEAEQYMERALPELDRYMKLTEVKDEAMARDMRRHAEGALQINSVYIDCATALEQMGRYEDVIHLYQQPSYQDLANHIADAAFARMYKMAVFKEFENFPKEAAFSAETMKKVAGQSYINVATTVAMCYRQIAGGSNSTDDWQKSMEPIVEALQRLGKDTPGHELDGAALHGSLALSYSGLGRFAEAHREFDQALQLSARTDPYYRKFIDINLYRGLGVLCLSQQPADINGAAMALERGDALAADSTDAETIWRQADLRGQVLEAKGNLAAAVQAYQKAVDLMERERLGLSTAEFRQTFFRPRQKLYEHYIRALHKMQRDEDGVVMMENVRARSLLDALHDVRVHKGISASLSQQMDQLRLQEIKLQIDSNRNKAGGGNAEGLRSASADLETSKSRTFAEILREAPELADLNGAKPLSPSVISALLDQDTVLLEYLAGEDYTAVAILTQNAPAVIVPLQATVVELRRQTDALRRQIQARRPSDDGWKAAAAALYQALLAPVEHALQGKKRLVIVPYDRLHYLPWAVLCRDASSPLLVDEHALVVLPSASVLKFCRDKGFVRRSVVAAFALGDVAVGDMPPLPGTLQEAKAISEVSKNAAVFAEKKFTLEAVHKNCSGKDVLHFATHGLLDSEVPTESAIITADGKLRVNDIFNLDLKCNLVVLSACQTGLGKVYLGDEMVGLTRAFMYAGTPSVLSTLWSVADASTARFMTLYYSNLQSMDKAAALQAAQLRLRQEFPHPFYWAPFVLNGDWK